MDPALNSYCVANCSLLELGAVTSLTLFKGEDCRILVTRGSYAKRRLPSRYVDMGLLQDQEQEKDQGGSGLITFVMVVLTWV